MPAERRAPAIPASLREEFVTDVLRARADHVPDGPDGADRSSYVLALGSPDHPVWLRVYPEGGGVRLDTDWTQIVLEGITGIRRQGHRLQLESVQLTERTTLDVHSNGQFSVRRVPMSASPETSRRSQR